MKTPHHRQTPPVVDHFSRKAAVACRQVVQNCLREEEWRDADQEFFRIIQQAFKELLDGNPPPQC